MDSPSDTRGKSTLPESIPVFVLRIIALYKTLAAAALNGLELSFPKDFEFPKSNKTPEYLAKFPLGKIPSFEASSGFCLTESKAIARYVAANGPKKNQLLGATPEEQALVDQWMFFNLDHLEKALYTPVRMRLGYLPYKGDREQEALTDLKRWLEYLDKHLSTKKWLVSDTAGPSLADLDLGQVFYVGFKVYLGQEQRETIPNIVRWYKELIEVPEVKKVWGEDEWCQEPTPIPAEKA